MIHKDFSDVLHPHGFICRGAIALHQMIQLNLVGLWLWSGMLGFKCGRPLRDHLIFLNKTLWILGHAGLRTRLHPRLKLKLYFLSIAQRTEPILPSPIGALIHLMHGLWHAYRAEFIFDHRVDMSTIKKALSPCKSCIDKPCLTACSVGAFKPDHYNVPACVDHLNTMAPTECGLRGCLARHACPVGQDFVYEPKHA